MKNKFFIFLTSAIIFTSGFTLNASNVQAKENIKLDACSVSENISPYLACCFNPDLVWVSSTTLVCKNCGKVVKW